MNNGNIASTDWLAENRERAIRGVLELTGEDGFIYTGYTCDRYPVKTGIRRGGVTLNFTNLVTGQEAYAIFNAILKREKTTRYGKKGDPLPTGHFRIGKGHSLYKFWRETELPTPRRLAALHDYMGNLKGLVFSCSLITDNPGKQGRIDTSQGIPPLTITAEQIQRALNLCPSLPDNSRTTPGQLPDNPRTTPGQLSRTRHHPQPATLLA